MPEISRLSLWVMKPVSLELPNTSVPAVVLASSVPVRERPLVPDPPIDIGVLKVDGTIVMVPVPAFSVPFGY